jgi:mycoredoxin
VTVTDTSPVIVYWRPGCPYCTGLRRRLRQLGVRTTEINIWDDPAGAAAVRGYADGNETVPTVVIAGTAMVNPTGPDVLAAARRLAPQAVSDAVPLPVPPRAWPKAATLVARVVVVAAVTASIVVHAGESQTLSWVLDAVAICAYLTSRLLRRRAATRSTVAP